MVISSFILFFQPFLKLGSYCCNILFVNDIFSLIFFTIIIYNPFILWLFDLYNNISVPSVVLFKNT